MKKFATATIAATIIAATIAATPASGGTSCSTPTGDKPKPEGGISWVAEVNPRTGKCVYTHKVYHGRPRY